jgi:hypothetical protein
MRERSRDSHIRHGHLVGGEWPGEYTVWSHMRSRCRNPSNRDYRHYGGRGITICERWDDFANFVADMGPRPTPKHSIDRIDNDGPYAPENCRWATKAQQMGNRRITLAVDYEGDRVPVADLAKRVGLPYRVLKNRVVRGWDLATAISTPVIPPDKKRNFVRP